MPTDLVLVDDVDVADTADELEAVEYHDDIYKFLQVKRVFPACKPLMSCVMEPINASAASLHMYAVIYLSVPKGTDQFHLLAVSSVKKNPSDNKDKYEDEGY
ncbi:unnamed protein product [Lupinus luteus]|uniref:Uncharacterized protein n=1 Tax=Lupinus luteus TaxID=3873 RepID=A0AAV1WJ92_LUPLU